MNHPRSPTSNDSTDHEAPALPEEVRAEMEERLLTERDRTQEDLETALEEESRPPAESSGSLSRYPSHPADAASDADEAHTDFLVAERSTERLNLIDAALDRLREHPESYGRCEVCGEPIDLERLRMVPWTRHCVDDAPESPGMDVGTTRAHR